MTTAVLGSTTIVKIGNGSSPQTFTTVHEVRNVQGFGRSRALIDVTHLLSPNSYREFIAGLKDGKQFTMMCNFDPSQSTHVTLMSDVEDGTARAYKITFPQFTPDKTYNFTGLCIDADLPVSPDAEVTITFTIKPTGAITETVA